MSSPLATVSKILTYSVVDGPGNRLVIFLQGCNFSCAACHNPHTMGQCNHCGDCVSACPQKALGLIEGKIVFDAGLCNQCDLCLEACPINANPMVREYSVEEILSIARKHKAFLSGITLSGGEATLQLKFIIDLFNAIKTDPELADLSCFIDTNGHLGEQSWQKLLPVTDGVMLDIKAFESGLHRSLTGQSNSRSLQSAQILNEAGKLYELRYLMIPKKTDNRSELDQLARFVESLGGDIWVKLNAFQHHGVKGDARNWPKMDEPGIEQAANHLRAAGVHNVITPAIYL